MFLKPFGLRPLDELCKEGQLRRSSPQFTARNKLPGRPYVKARHNAALRERIPRSRGSVEFKYENVSAVLEKLGMPWIPGYKPARHYQGAIAEAISRYLAHDPSAVDIPAASPQVPAPDAVFVPSPVPIETQEQMPASLRRLIVKFDPVERDRRNRALGRAGEEFVLGLERRQLVELGRQDLSRNELEVSKQRPEDWRIYRVHLFATSPRIFTLAPPLDNVLHLRPELWRASL